MCNHFPMTNGWFELRAAQMPHKPTLTIDVCAASWLRQKATRIECWVCRLRDYSALARLAHSLRSGPPLLRSGIQRRCATLSNGVIHSMRRQLPEREAHSDGRSASITESMD